MPWKSGLLLQTAVMKCSSSVLCCLHALEHVQAQAGFPQIRCGHQNPLLLAS